jgi:3-polyprenyl-4-hydroxybenzoate decarboxylase
VTSSSSGGNGIYVDRSSVSEGISGKLFIDATKKKEVRGKVVEPTRGMMLGI